MAAKKNTPPTTKQTGVEKIIGSLQRNKANIGAIVVGVIATPGKKLKSGANGESEGFFVCGDTITATSDLERQSDALRSVITQGIANEIKERVLRKPGSLFG